MGGMSKEQTSYQDIWLKKREMGHANTYGLFFFSRQTIKGLR